MDSRHEELRSLNRRYIEAWLAADVDWYRGRLAEDFVCIESDGNILDKAAFLRSTARGSDVSSYRLDEVDVRLYGDVGLVRATGSWEKKDGVRGLSRYIDVYVRFGHEWKVVSAQITRPPRAAGS
jgi:hypothetical protein